MLHQSILASSQAAVAHYWQVSKWRLGVIEMCKLAHAYMGQAAVVTVPQLQECISAEVKAQEKRATAVLSLQSTAVAARTDVQQT